ncbi:DUF721 domain-containing protein [Litoreibacter roseus]|uniref:DUF721 domain-containing protein n=1 Tax=Litoreibacter roseus TaxID=2601869 RepID=A0A6N6JJ00_9RHOB|nr:DciA family protein [Litoreibacter roseus]GFE66246.1 hypothetical protein KIN_33200 [Litoreibacter roseus]
MTRNPYPSQPRKPAPRGRGFGAVAGMIQGQVRKAGEKRGFAVMRLLTHWSEIVGPDLATIAKPVKVGYSRDSFGATLTILTKGAHAPMVQAQLPKIRERVNSVYGYSAISNVRITQTAPVGFEEGRLSFDAEPRPPKPAVSPELRNKTAELARDVESDSLRHALEQLGQNVLGRKADPKT